MKLFVVNNFYHPHSVGGAEESLRLQLEALASDGNQVTVFTVAHDASEKSTWLNGVKVEYIRTIFSSGSPLSLRRSLWKRLGWQFGDVLRFRFLRRFFASLSRDKPDCIYVNNVAGMSRAVVLIAKALNIPVILALRDYSWSCLRQNQFRNGRNCVRRCFSCTVGGAPRRFVASLADGVVANSETILNTHKNFGLFSRQPTSVIYAGATRSDFAPTGGAPTGKVQVGVIGQINPTKGVAEFLQEVSGLIPNYDLSVVIAGGLNSAYAQGLRDRWAGQGWVRFAGHVDRQKFYSLVDIVVIPSLWMEPLSRVTYEAMASGKCVIASNWGGQKEIITHRQNGYLYTPRTAELAEVLGELLESRRKIGEVGFAAWNESAAFSPAVAAAGLLAAVHAVRKEA